MSIMLSDQKWKHVNTNNSSYYCYHKQVLFISMAMIYSVNKITYLGKQGGE